MEKKQFNITLQYKVIASSQTEAFEQLAKSQSSYESTITYEGMRIVNLVDVNVIEEDIKTK